MKETSRMRYFLNTVTSYTTLCLKKTKCLSQLWLMWADFQKFFTATMYPWQRYAPHLKCLSWKKCHQFQQYLLTFTLKHIY